MIGETVCLYSIGDTVGLHSIGDTVGLHFIGDTVDLHCIADSIYLHYIADTVYLCCIGYTVGLHDIGGTVVIHCVGGRWVAHVTELYDDERGDRPYASNQNGCTIMKSEIENVIKEMKCGKASDNDDIATEMIKAIEDEGIKKITELFNLVYDTG